jgi:hypothetical protein
MFLQTSKTNGTVPYVVVDVYYYACYILQICLIQILGTTPFQLVVGLL